MRLSWLHRHGGGLEFLDQTSLVSAPAWGGRAQRPSVLRSHWERLADPGRRRSLALTALAFALGLFLVAQWQSPRTDLVSDTNSRDAAIHRTIDRLEAEQADLKRQIATLRAKAAADQQQLTRTQAMSANLSRALDEQRALAGTVPVVGPGIEILLDDSNRQTILPSEDPDLYIVHEFQIRDIVNLLWGSGASAIAINGERFVNSTSVYCVGSTILINDTRTSPPYHILAVGDIDRMQRAFLDGSNLRDLKSRAQLYGLVVKVVRTGPMTIPAFNGSVDMKHTEIAYTPG